MIYVGLSGRPPTFTVDPMGSTSQRKGAFVEFLEAAGGRYTELFFNGVPEDEVPKYARLKGLVSYAESKRKWLRKLGANEEILAETLGYSEIPSGA